MKDPNSFSNRKSLGNAAGPHQPQPNVAADARRRTSLIRHQIRLPYAGCSDDFCM